MMKSFLGVIAVAILFAILRGTGVTEMIGEKFGYGVPDEPVYFESRATLAVAGRELEALIVGKTKFESECDDFLSEFIRGFTESCPPCKITKNACPAKLRARYLPLLDGQQWHLSYLQMDLGWSEHRKAAIVLLGVTQEEAAVVCMDLANQWIPMAETRCVHPR